MSRWFPLTLLSVCGLGVLCAPAGAADLMAGKALAEGWCATCHVVAAEQTSSMKGAPPFLEIAKRTTTDYSVLEGIIAKPHPPMLNFDLTRDQIQDLLAYINSLRPR